MRLKNIISRLLLSKIGSKPNYDYSAVCDPVFGETVPVPDPWNPVEDISLSQFARKTGVNKSTILYRFHRYFDGTGHYEQSSMTHREPLIEFLLNYIDRKTHITVYLLDGKVIHGGIRECYRLYRSHCEKNAWQPVCSLSWFKKNFRSSSHFHRYGINHIALH